MRSEKGHFIGKEGWEMGSVNSRYLPTGFFGGRAAAKSGKIS
jgi:hypothetical protein